MSSFSSMTLKDTKGIVVGPAKEGEQLNTQDLLYSIVRELKITNMHLTLLTDTQITKNEVE